MEDKDRMGDKLRDKGKAAEDLYIQEQERRRLEQQKVASPGCPRDGAKLESRRVNDVAIDVCPACEGIWLDKGELEAMTREKSDDFIVRWVRSLFGA